MELSQGKVGLIASTKKSHYIDKVEGDHLFRDPNWVRESGVQAFAGFPLVVDERLLGVFAIFCRSPLPPGSLEALHSVANQMALGIQRQQSDEAIRLAHDRLEHRVQERTEQLARANDVLRKEILERQRTERALRQAEEKYRTIFENAIDGIFQTSPDGYFLSANPAMARILGYSTVEELITSVRHVGRQVYVDPARRLRFVQMMEEYGAVIEFESQVYRREGTIIWITENARCIRDQKGKLLYYEGTVEDITRRKEAEAQIREQAALLDKVQDAISVLDLSFRILYWNPAGARLFGWSSAEACGKYYPEIVYESAALQEARKAVLGKGEWSGELLGRTRQGCEVTLDSQWTLLRDDNGHAKSVLVVNTDVTEKKRLEAKFLRAQRMESIGTLAGGIAHDLNNVLTPILMSLQLLRVKWKDEQSQRMLLTLENSARRGADMVKQVLTFARGVEGERSCLHPEHLIREMVKIAQETFPKSIKIVTDVTPGTQSIQGDPTQLHQVLMNLCVNARDAMPNGGLLKISSQNVNIDANYAEHHPDARPGNYVLITVSDTGCGIPPGIMEKMFEPFFTTKEPGKGTGLGLSTVVGIVKSHHGFMNVYSELARGTQFHVYLPSVSSTISEDQVNPLGDLPLGKGETILVIDDETSIREICKKTLEAYGYNVLTANDGTEAVAVYAEQQEHIKLVITDMMMPYLDGASTIRALHRINPRIRMVASSGVSSHRYDAENAGHGVQAFLAKPYTADRLLEIVAKVLKEDSLSAAGSQPS
jgi:hypothetical protein